MRAGRKAERPLVFQYKLQYVLPVIALFALGIFWFTRPQAANDAESILATVETEYLVAYLNDSELTPEDVLEEVDFSSIDIQDIEMEIYQLQLDDQIFDEAIDLAARVGSLLAADDDFDLAAPPQLSTLVFRYRPRLESGERLSEDAADAARDATVTPRELRELLDSGKKFALIDVREQVEWDINRIPGATLIPKGDFLNGSALEKIPSVDSGKQIVLHCKSGVRSAEVLAILKGAGYSDAVHVGGGVVAWVNQVDPSQPSY